MLLPVETETFFEAIQDEEPLLISRPNNRAYFDGLFSRAGVQPGSRCLSACDALLLLAGWGGEHAGVMASIAACLALTIWPVFG